MRLGGRLAGAIEVLDDIETRRRPVADALKDWGLSHRFAGSGDRAAIGNIVYDALRLKLSHAWLFDDISALTLGYAVMFRQWGFTPEALALELEGDRFAPPALPDEQLAAFSSRRLADAPLHVQGDVPEWTVASFQENFGDGWLAEAQALTARPSLDLRANTLKADRDKVVKALERAGAGKAPLAPNAVRVAAGKLSDRLPNVTAELSFQKGWFEVQDEGSQLASLLTGAKPGEQVLDLCAGAGGKSLAMAAAMENKGQVFATDSDRGRLAPIFDRLKRAGTRNVQVRPARSDLGDLEGHMDAVLLDVPCTGTGTWRRRPDAKWRLTERALEDRIAEQSGLLDAAVRYLKPGGRIVYVTCSLLPDENGDQLRAFVGRQEGFRIVPPAEVVAASGLPAATKAALDGAIGEEGLLLTPHRTGTDGFFVGILERV